MLEEISLIYMDHPIANSILLSLFLYVVYLGLSFHKCFFKMFIDFWKHKKNCKNAKLIKKMELGAVGYKRFANYYCEGCGVRYPTLLCIDKASHV